VVGANIPFRFLVPWSALRSARLQYEAGVGARERARSRSARVLGPLSCLRITLTGRIGKIGLRRAEIEELEPGDVALLDEPDAWPKFESGRLGGAIRLAFDGCEERAGSIAVEILEDSRNLIVAVNQLITALTMREANRRMRKVSANEPNEAESTDVPRAKGASKAAAGYPEAAALAEEAPVQIRVELGRVRMTVAELAELSPGSILELRKDPEQPVSLLIEDRVVARGELVRVEGELGVRILSLY
jgi:flagellar motor switch protein FliM